MRIRLNKYMATNWIIFMIGLIGSLLVELATNVLRTRVIKSNGVKISNRRTRKIIGQELINVKKECDIIDVNKLQ